MACETPRCCSAKELRAASARFVAKRGESKAFENCVRAPTVLPEKRRLLAVGRTGTAPWIVPT
jgi:hypothetical protein